MIELHQFPPAYGLPNASPFCMKVENYLRMAGLPYVLANGFELSKAPKGKLPFIIDEGRVIADSGIIIDYLKAAYGDPLDAHLNARERALALAFTRMMDEHLYWSAGIYPRWIEAQGWEITRVESFQSLPFPIRHIAPLMARRAIKKEFWGHGMGRHAREEIYALACADIAALADFLGGQAFFLGDQPTTLDAAAYAHLANILWSPFDTPAQAHAQARANLQAYCLRMKARFYP
jgi:glutathione S-transferase